MLMLLVGVAVLTFASLVYFAEKVSFTHTWGIFGLLVWSPDMEKALTLALVHFLAQKISTKNA